MKERERIPSGTKYLMLGVAVLFETAQVLFGMLWALGPVIGGSLVGCRTP